MKNLKMFVALLFVFVFTFATPPRANAVIVGVGVAFAPPIEPVGLALGLGMVIGGVSLVVIGGSIFEDALDHRKERNFFVTFFQALAGAVLTLAGGVAGAENQDGLPHFDVGADLEQQVRLGLKTPQQAEEIKNQTNRILEMHASKPLLISFKKANTKQEMLQILMDEAQVSAATASYWLQANGIQVGSEI